MRLNCPGFAKFSYTVYKLRNLIHSEIEQGEYYAKCRRTDCHHVEA